MLPKSNIETKLDAETVRGLDKLAKLEPKSEEYKATLEQVSKLHKLKIDERLKLPSLDTLLIVSANIFGILWLARYENENIIKAPKAFASIIKPR